MADVTVPDRPVLVTVPSVELIHAGTWQISTGEWNVTAADLYAAVAALDCPAVRRPVLKLGHTDPRFDGEPAIGWVDNLAVSAGGVQLVGDYCGLPAWLGDVLASAYPDRSIEGEYEHRCQIGHTHPFVLTAVALLGITAPGVGTLQSLQDIAALYGVAATAADTDTSFRVPITAKGTPMPPTTTLSVAASATVEDVRRSFYEGPAATNWWWIEEVYIDPTEVIAIDDADGLLWRVPFTVAADGTVTWGTEQQVKREYVAASTGVRKPLASWASRTESRPDQPAEPPRAATTSTTPAEVTPPKEDDVSSTLTEGLRQRLGITDADADDATLLTALDEALAEQTAPPGTAAPTLPEGTVAIEAETLAQLQAAARRGDEARTRQEREDREDLVSAAIADGRIAPARRQHWLAQLEADAGSAEVLASLATGLVPVSEAGHGQNPHATAGGAAQDLGWFDSVPPAPKGV